jgi:hypothetical protein
MERRQSSCKVLGEESLRESTCRVRFRSGGCWRNEGGARGLHACLPFVFFLVVV